MNYIQECIADGSLAPDSSVWISDSDDKYTWPVHNVDCDFGILTVSD